MKVYRVVPNSFVNSINNENTGLFTNAFFKAEDVYYKLGYTSFLQEEGTFPRFNGGLNNLSLSEEGKHFFLFPDDAIMNAYGLINSYRGLSGFSFNLLVYDFPVDKIIQNIGFGNYSQGISGKHSIETIIGMSTFGQAISSSDIPNEDKLEVASNLFKQSIINEFYFADKHNASQSYLTLYNYLNYLELRDFESLKGLVNDDEWLKDLVKDSLFYNNLKKIEGPVIKNEFLTDVMIPINQYALKNHWYGEPGYKKFSASSYLKEFNYDYTEIENLEELKSSLLRLVYGEIHEQERNEIKSLLLKKCK